MSSETIILETGPDSAFEIDAMTGQTWTIDRTDGSVDPETGVLEYLRIPCTPVEAMAAHINALRGAVLDLAVAAYAVHEHRRGRLADVKQAITDLDRTATLALMAL